MTFETFDALPVGTHVDWNGWGDIDAGIICEREPGPWPLRWIAWRDGSMNRPGGLDLVEVLYGPVARPQAHGMQETGLCVCGDLSCHESELQEALTMNRGGAA
jgi:hypothetical protein